MKSLFSRICDISGTSERIPVRIRCSSRHTILSYCFELKRENTSRDRKISVDIWRCSKYGDSNDRRSNYREPTVRNILSTNFSNMSCY